MGNDQVTAWPSDDASTWLTFRHREDLRAIFDPVVTDILRLIKIQVQSVQLKERDSKVTVGSVPIQRCNQC